jgi:predicted metal-dependent peptidase
MNHPKFSTLSGAIMMGVNALQDGLPTAGTNGRDIYYGAEFVMRQSRKQLRYVQLHEATHIALRHCIEYTDLVKKYPRESNIAMDYVVNALIEQTDPMFVFVERPKDPVPLVDPKYFDRAFVDVLQDLLRNADPQQKQQQEFDTHMPAPTDVDKEELQQAVQDALNHGDMVQKRLAGSSGSANPLHGLGVDRTTNWRNALREWVSTISKGDSYSRFNPPNRRFLPLGIIMPTHFDTTAGEIAILADSSGSMHSIYPVLFGEIANICRQANPDCVRLIWWDDKVRSEQVFKRGQYDTLAQALQPVGGGGTSPQAVTQYVQEKKYKLSGAIWLTDGYLDAKPTRVCSNELWGVFNNDFFKPAHGKVLRIHA